MTAARSDLMVLKPCPFCGAMPHSRIVPNPNGTKYPTRHQVWCENLDCAVGAEADEDTYEGVIAAWNTRAASQPDREAVIQECISAALDVGNFGSYRREELTTDFGQPRFDMMNSIVQALSALLSGTSSRKSGGADTKSDGGSPSIRTAGGFPVAAAPSQAEETGVISGTRQDPQHGTPHGSGVTGGESATPSVPGPSDPSPPAPSVREALLRDWKTVEEQIANAHGNDLLALLRDYLIMNSQPGNDLAPLYIARINATLSSPHAVAGDAEEVTVWPPLKKALWDVIVGENLNDGHYVKAFDLTEKLYAAALSVSTVAVTREDVARLSASEQACYRWSEDTAEHRAMRTAFMDGAAYIAGNAGSEVIAFHAREIKTIALCGWSNHHDQDFGTKGDEYKLDCILEHADAILSLLNGTVRPSEGEASEATCHDCGYSDPCDEKCPNCNDANEYGDYEGPTCETCGGIGRIHASCIKPIRPESSGANRSETEAALHALEDECWDLRCVNIPTGGDDYDIGWRVIEHYQAEPKERIVGYGNSPLAALKNATNRARP